MTRFLITQGLGGAVIGRSGAFTKQLQNEHNVILKLTEPKVTGYEYSLAELQGTFRGVLETIQLFVEKVETFDKA